MPDSEKKKWIERLQDSYKIVVMDEEDLREVSSYSLSLKSLYVLIFTLFLVFTTLIVSLILFTPIKHLVPGYGRIENDKAYMELFDKIEELEDQMKAQDVYTIGLQNMLKGMEASGPDKSLDNLPVKKNIYSDDIDEIRKTGILNQLIFSPPLSGTISKEYDVDTDHFGVDILAPKNTPVKAVLDGVVINASWSDEYGNLIYIQHPKSIISVYKHNSALLVKTGQRVRAGQAIAIIGNTGTLSSGPHLHFELWYNGIVVNPVNYITF